ncbi:MAG: prepilin-type N-terminal cleavage/methylation domain-containing protein [bacterium]|nr:prepilin-type N-terminal cleavage/methylation domain-containing protein [bacterium]
MIGGEKNKAHVRAGFTLMEMLVAIAVFSITIGVTSDLFLTATRQQRRTTVRSALESDARFVLETITREVREGRIDRAVTDALAIIHFDDTQTRFRMSTTDCVGDSGSCIAIGRVAADGSIAWAALTGADIAVGAFDVHTGDASLQDYATVRLQLTAAGARAGERETTEAQTTIASRVYIR